MILLYHNLVVGMTIEGLKLPYGHLILLVQMWWVLLVLCSKWVRGGDHCLQATFDLFMLKILYIL